MRLSAKEQKALINSFKENLTSIKFKLYLFGSRANDLKRGGDIDLLIIVEPEFKQHVVNLKTKIRSKIFDYIPEQKIDITVASDGEIDTDPFLAEIFPQALLLFKHHGSLT